MLSGDGAITIVSLALTTWAGELESVTLTVTVELPAVVGVPETRQAERVRPAGRVPPEIEQVYGVVPPAAVIAEL
jgi:hypothetical protein